MQAGRLTVSNCHDTEPNLQAIDTLVMPDDRKNLIKALVQKFTNQGSKVLTKSWRADFIENKGEGQIFLLHGSPGVGKTFVSLKLYVLRNVC